jgi:hypothetical protein
MPKEEVGKISKQEGVIINFHLLLKMNKRSIDQ